MKPRYYCTTAWQSHLVLTRGEKITRYRHLALEACIELRLRNAAEEGGYSCSVIFRDSRLRGVDFVRGAIFRLWRTERERVRKQVLPPTASPLCRAWSRPPRPALLPRRGPAWLPRQRAAPPRVGGAPSPLRWTRCSPLHCCRRRLHGSS